MNSFNAFCLIAILGQSWLAIEALRRGYSVWGFWINAVIAILLLVMTVMTWDNPPPHGWC
jgi:hypothetical protein